MSEDYFEIIPDLLNAADMPAFRFVINAITLKIVGAWDADGKYHPRNKFNPQVEQLAREKENEKRRA